MRTTLFFREIIREHRVGLIKGLMLLCFGCYLSLSGCSEVQNLQTAVYVEVLKSDLRLKQLEGRWYLDNSPFNGTAVSCYADGTIAERITYLAGKKEGPAFKWYDNGVQRRQAFYKSNKLDGTLKTWWPNGSLSTESNYVLGIKQGYQKKWYPNGQLSRLTHLVNGREEGMQQAWLKNGKLYVNYEARNGRTFGLRKAKLCYELEDEIVQR